MVFNVNYVICVFHKKYFFSRVCVCTQKMTLVGIELLGHLPVHHSFDIQKAFTTIYTICRELCLRACVPEVHILIAET